MAQKKQVKPASSLKFPAYGPPKMFWPIAIVVLAFIGIFYWLYNVPIIDAYRAVIPSSEMKALKKVEKSLPLPEPLSTRVKDRGCYTEHDLYSQRECERYISVSYSSGETYNTLTAYLEQNGWKKAVSDTDTIDPQVTHFLYSKGENIGGKPRRVCVSGYIRLSENGQPLKAPFNFLITGPTDMNCYV